VRPEGLGKFKKFNDLIENRTRDLPACSHISITSEIITNTSDNTKTKKSVYIYIYIYISFQCYSCYNYKIFFYVLYVVSYLPGFALLFYTYIYIYILLVSIVLPYNIVCLL
jgi:hypothetical protein